MKRNLSLKRETLVELTPDDLMDVVGAALTVQTQPAAVCANVSRMFMTCTCCTGSASC
ncbi:MAG TPA: hypothetical protein VNQ77_00115 [Frankiaceae bacterium]|nr:hypothetical protein [Frankiaceae bacterium]